MDQREPGTNGCSEGEFKRRMALYRAEWEAECDEALAEAEVPLSESDRDAIVARCRTVALPAGEFALDEYHEFARLRENEERIPDRLRYWYRIMGLDGKLSGIHLSPKLATQGVIFGPQAEAAAVPKDGTYTDRVRALVRRYRRTPRNTAFFAEAIGCAVGTIHSIYSGLRAAGWKDEKDGDGWLVWTEPPEPEPEPETGPPEELPDHVRDELEQLRARIGELLGG